MPKKHDAPPPVKGIDPQTFSSASDPAMLRYLDEHGYAVIKGAADAAAVSRGHDDFWQFHEDLGDEDGQCEQVLRDDPSTWGQDFLPHPATGIVTGCGFGNSRFCWCDPTCSLRTDHASKPRALTNPQRFA